MILENCANSEVTPRALQGHSEAEGGHDSGISEALAFAALRIRDLKTPRFGSARGGRRPRTEATCTTAVRFFGESAWEKGTGPPRRDGSHFPLPRREATCTTPARAPLRRE